MNDFLTNQRTIETDLNKSIGFNPGDNIMTLAPPSGNTGGITHLIRTADASAPTFGKPESRMLAEIARGTSTDITRESIVHETGHLLGFDERYWDPSKGQGVLVQEHNDFKWDFMTAAGGKSTTTMHPQHIEDAARFAIGVANGRTLVDQTIRGIQIDDTGTYGDTEMFKSSGAVNPKYTALQTTLSTELTPFFRAQAGTVAPLPAPAPVPAPNPKLVPVP